VPKTKWLNGGGGGRREGKGRNAQLVLKVVFIFLQDIYIWIKELPHKNSNNVVLVFSPKNMIYILLQKFNLL
jgi:hypothetical protein